MFLNAIKFDLFWQEDEVDLFGVYHVDVPRPTTNNCIVKASRDEKEKLLLLSKLAQIGFSERTDKNFDSNISKNGFTINFLLKPSEESCKHVTMKIGDFYFRIEDSEIKLTSPNLEKSKRLLMLKINKQPPSKLLHFKSTNIYMWVSILASDLVLGNNFIKFGFGECFENNLIAHFLPTYSESLDLLQKIKKSDIHFYGDNLAEKIGISNAFVCDLNPLIFKQGVTGIEELQKNQLTYINLPEEIHPHYVKIKEIVIEKKLYDAIEYSIETEGCLLNKKLKEKAQIFGDLKTTYIRIPLGVNFGIQPGQPYVLEIWPKGHSSPIHNHGNATAIIKIFYGKLKTEWYNPLAEENEVNPTPIKSDYLEPGDFTFMTPFLFQTHKLINESDSTALSLQAYAHTVSNTNNEFSNAFHYIKPNETDLKRFLPKSDFEFEEFEKIVLLEHKTFIERNQVKTKFVFIKALKNFLTLLHSII